jgi:hypothetical protein
MALTNNEVKTASLKLKPTLISNHFWKDTLFLFQKYLNYFDGFQRKTLSYKIEWNEQDLKITNRNSGGNMLSLIDKLDDFHLLNTGEVTATSYIVKRCMDCSIPMTSMSSSAHMFCCEQLAHVLGHFNRVDSQCHLLDCRYPIAHPWLVQVWNHIDSNNHVQ